MNLSDVLSPYANDQPKNLSMHTRKIERIPSLASAEGVNKKFQTFYTCLCEFILSQDIKNLYEISDKCVSLAEFSRCYNNNVGKHLSRLFDLPSNEYGIDIELNIKQFESIHRNLIGSFYVITYQLLKPDNFGSVNVHTSLDAKYSEVFFTYKNNEFMLISAFGPFICGE